MRPIFFLPRFMRALIRQHLHATQMRFYAHMRRRPTRPVRPAVRLGDRESIWRWPALFRSRYHARRRGVESFHRKVAVCPPATPLRIASPSRAGPSCRNKRRRTSTRHREVRNDPTADCGAITSSRAGAETMARPPGESGGAASSSRRGLKRVSPALRLGPAAGAWLREPPPPGSPPLPSAPSPWGGSLGGSGGGSKRGDLATGAADHRTLGEGMYLEVCNGRGVKARCAQAARRW